jgi:hypothetical protein
MTPPIRPPTADELLADAVVQQALDAAWVESRPDDPVLRHEEGGWIYMDLATGRLSTIRTPMGSRDSIGLFNPPPLAGSVIVGIFHTHPNPTAEGWVGGPSDADRRIDARLGVPDLIRADDGTYVSGPMSRCGGLSGSPGYPD